MVGTSQKPYLTFQEHTQENDSIQEGTPNPESPLLCIKHVKQSNPKAMIVPVTINGKEINKELDTGAAVSVISKELWKSMFSAV